MEHVVRSPGPGPSLPALLCCRDGVANERRRARLFLLLPYSRLSRGPRPFRPLHVAPRRFLHGAVVEPHAAIPWTLRLPEHHPACVLCLQADLPADRRPSRCSIERCVGPCVSYL